jgi:hypothetical protein
VHTIIIHSLPHHHTDVKSRGGKKVVPRPRVMIAKCNALLSVERFGIDLKILTSSSDGPVDIHVFLSLSLSLSLQFVYHISTHSQVSFTLSLLLTLVNSKNKRRRPVIGTAASRRRNHKVVLKQESRGCKYARETKLADNRGRGRQRTQRDDVDSQPTLYHTPNHGTDGEAENRERD